MALFEDLDSTIKAQWVEALRSGNFDQGKGRLKALDPIANTVEHCCLGVLCEVLELDEYTNTEGNQVFCAYNYLDEHLYIQKGVPVSDDTLQNSLMLPDDLANHLNLESHELALLMSMNDGCIDKSVGNGEGKRYTFSEIASIIEDGTWDQMPNNRAEDDK